MQARHARASEAKDLNLLEHRFDAFLHLLDNPRYHLVALWRRGQPAHNPRGVGFPIVAGEGRRRCAQLVLEINVQYVDRPGKPRLAANSGAVCLHGCGIPNLFLVADVGELGCLVRHDHRRGVVRPLVEPDAKGTQDNAEDLQWIRRHERAKSNGGDDTLDADASDGIALFRRPIKLLLYEERDVTGERNEKLHGAVPKLDVEGRRR
mmetsp:Transcript_7207/g.18032  ORF Transcript_7207/g.18032 Transcript_7207/m.18032 type:complete len:207 (-) Transcript_7207:103-723(-)